MKRESNSVPNQPILDSRAFLEMLDKHEPFLDSLKLLHDLWNETVITFIEVIYLNEINDLDQMIKWRRNFLDTIYSVLPALFKKPSEVFENALELKRKIIDILELAKLDEASNIELSFDNFFGAYDAYLTNRPARLNTEEEEERPGSDKSFDDKNLSAYEAYLADQEEVPASHIIRLALTATELVNSISLIKLTILKGIEASKQD